MKVDEKTETPRYEKILAGLLPDSVRMRYDLPGFCATGARVDVNKNNALRIVTSVRNAEVGSSILLRSTNESTVCAFSH
jgi:hypothetical protein